MKKIFEKRKGAVLLLVASLILMQTTVYGSSTSDKIKQAEQEQENTEQQLDAAKDTLDDLKDSEEAIKKSLNNLKEQLSENEAKKKDIQNQITEKEEEIQSVEKEYEDAVAQADEQYQFIKARIKNIYERGSDNFVDMVLNTSSMADFLNRATYIAKMNDYDQKMLGKLKDLQDDAKTKQAKLVADGEELQGLYNELEEEGGDLEELKDSTENSLVSYAGAISEKEREALEYEAKLVASQSTIAQLKTKLKEEEELARKAEKMAFRDLSEVSVGGNERDLLAAIIQCEAGGEPYAGKIAVGAVIMNRVRSAAFPNTITGVVYQSNQFQPVRSGRLAIRLAEGANSECYKAADEVLAGANNIGKCLFFRTVVPGIQGTIIGHHVFYLYWTGVESGYGTVEDSLTASGNEAEEKAAAEKAASEAAASEAAASEAAASKASEEASSEEAESGDTPSEDASSKAASEAASKEAASKAAASEAASKEAASKAAASEAASKEAASKASEEAAASEEASKASEEEASKKASEEASKKASEEASKKASEEAAKKASEEEASKKASEEAASKAAEEAAASSESSEGSEGNSNGGEE